VPSKPNWRSSTDHNALNRLERPDFAWEFLRRNRNYRAEYERITRHQADGAHDDISASAEIARYWGVMFRCGPRYTRIRGEGLMACRTRADSSPVIVVRIADWSDSQGMRRGASLDACVFGGGWVVSSPERGNGWFQITHPTR